jgi:hypothetical protein
MTLSPNDVYRANGNHTANGLANKKNPKLGGDFVFVAKGN